jgi:hypothetical protein
MKHEEHSPVAKITVSGNSWNMDYLSLPEGTHNLYLRGVYVPAAGAPDRPSIAPGSAIQKLGARLTELLDDDQWNNIEPLLLAIASDHPSHSERIGAAMWCMFEYGKRDFHGCAKETVEEILALLTSDRPSDCTLTDAEMSDALQRAAVATDNHCEGLPHTPSKEYSDAYFFRAVLRAAKSDHPSNAMFTNIHQNRERFSAENVKAALDRSSESKPEILVVNDQGNEVAIRRRDDGKWEMVGAFIESDPLEPVSGDLLPPIGSTVQIHLNSRNAWVDHTVVGYYVYGALAHQVKGDPAQSNAHRVFVRVVDAEGTPNARLLSEVRFERKT